MGRREEEEALGGPIVSIAKGGVGKLSALSAVVGDFDWSVNSVKAKQGGSYYTLYTPSGGEESVELTPGENWELMVYWSCANNEAGWPITGWSAGITMVASSAVPSAYREQFKGARMETASSFSNMNYDLNMGAMPSSNVTIYRIKFWATQMYTLQSPPSDEW
jgi:hypothetical protein